MLVGRARVRDALFAAKQMQIDGHPLGERAWHIVFDLMQHHYVTGPPRDERPLVVGGYIGRGVDRLRLPAILADTEVASLLPVAVSRLLGKPLVVYKYHTPLMLLVCNWAQASRGAGAKEPPCVCQQPRFAPFKQQQSGHVVTKDVNIAQSAELRELLRRGMSYRMRPLPARPNQQAGESGESDSRPRGMTLVVEMVEQALHAFATKCEELLGVDQSTLLPWQMAVLQAVEQRVLDMTPSEVDEVDRWAGNQVEAGWSMETAREVRQLQRSFVIAPADKETGVFVFACRRHWEESLWREVRSTPTYKLVGQGAQQFLLNEQGLSVAEVERQIRNAPRPPPPTMPTTPMGERATLAVAVTESMRIMRASHGFGVICVPVWSAVRPPSQMELERAHEWTLEALEHEARHMVQGRTQMWLKAAARVRQVSFWIRSHAAWQRTWAELRAAGRPVTRTLTCPVDVQQLQAWAASPAGQQVVLHKDGTSTGTTGAAMVASFLFRTRHAQQLTLHYRHAELAADAIAAGIVCAGREMAVEVEPFKLRSSIRGHAMARFGFDLDDRSSYPTALAFMISSGREAASFLRRHIKELRFAIGDAVFVGTIPRAVRYERAKQLINSLDMDGTYGSWVTKYRADVVPGHTLSDMSALSFVDNVGVSRTFDFAAYVQQQPARTQELAQRKPQALRFFQLAKRMGNRTTEPERTLKSHFCAEAEAISRAAKLRWCEQTGARPLNLQHDGVVIMLPSNRTDVAAVVADLTRHCSAALGYEQVVEHKPWGVGVPTTDFVEIQPSAVALGLSYVDALRSQCRYAIQQGMLRRVSVPQGAAWTAAGQDDLPRDYVTDADPAKLLMAAINRYKLPYLYGTVKTHKDPYGWRYLAGGREQALNLVSDWVHRCLAALLPDIHALAREALAGIIEDDPLPCQASFIIRDTRDAVARVMDLERRRRVQRVRARQGLAAPPVPWRQVEFGVHDFTTLYPMLPHDLIREAVGAMVDACFARHPSSQPGMRTELGVNPRTREASWRQVEVTQEEDRSPSGVRFFSQTAVKAHVHFILATTFVTVGDEVHQQVRGIPMGLSCSPMLAVVMLARYEIRQLGRMRDAALQPPGSPLELPDGMVTVTPASRAAMLNLAARFSRCCRAIDDVLLIDMSRVEQTWILAQTYPAELELKMVCCSPGVVQYLDMEIRHDRGGFHTVMYDKRDELRLAGKMGAVRRCPHPDSLLSRQCKYATLTTFLHRAYRVCRRCKAFVSAVAQRMQEMVEDGYELRRLRSVLERFVRQHVPRHVRRLVLASVRRRLRGLGGDGAAASTIPPVPVTPHVSHEERRYQRERSAQAAAQFIQRGLGDAAARVPMPARALTPVATLETVSHTAATSRSVTPRVELVGDVFVDVTQTVGARSTVSEVASRPVQLAALDDVLSSDEEEYWRLAPDALTFDALCDRLDAPARYCDWGYRLIHVSEHPTVTTVDQFISAEGAGKPGGLWFAKGADWLRHCHAEHMQEWLQAAAAVYELWPISIGDRVMEGGVPARGFANVTEEAAVDEVIQLYGDTEGRVDWHAMAQDGYDGVAVSGLADFRLATAGRAPWVCAWDVDSACLWDTGCVAAYRCLAIRRADGRYDWQKVEARAGGGWVHTAAGEELERRWRQQGQQE